MESCKMDGALWSACKPSVEYAPRRIETILEKAVDRARSIDMKDIVLNYI
jgi:hypothetical protein